MSRRPDLFIIGAPKCGTTSLYAYLKGHPEVFMAADKEPDYFAPDLVWRTVGEPMIYGRDLERYLSLFSGAQDRRRLGEASTRYMYSQRAPRLIHEFQPQARIIAMLRDPVDMLQALHNQRVAEGTEDIVDFEQALAADEDRRRGRRLPAGMTPLVAPYRGWARFGEQLPRWFDAFGRDRVQVIILDDLVRDPADTFCQVLQFLDVDSTYQPDDFAVHNPSHRPRSHAVRALLNAQGPRQVARRLVPYQLRDRLRRSVVRPIRRLNRKAMPRSAMPPELRRQLEAEFASDVAMVSDLLDRDLPALWWRQRADAASQPESPGRAA